MHRLRLRFEVCGRAYTDTVLQLGPVFYTALSGIHKSGPMPQTAEALTRDEFLKTVVLVVNRRHFTIGDLITYAANVAGGVHSGQPRDEQHRALDAFRGAFVGEQPVQIAQLAGIIKVVIDALAPLEAVVTSETSAES